MAAPDASLVVIACPHCSTRYQVAYATIGAKGRTVACAHCGKSWEARAEPPPPPRQKDFEELAEEALDEKFIEEERRAKAKREATLRAEIAAREVKARERAEALAAAEERAAAKAAAPMLMAATEDDAEALEPERQEAGEDATPARSKAAAGEKLDHAARKRQQREFSQRQQSVHNRLPLARMRRLARVGASISLVLVIGAGVMLRGAIVQQFPGLAGAYAAVGLGVNVVGLEFSDIRTLKSLQQGAEVLVVDGNIRSVAGHEVAMPPVIVTLLGVHGEALYEWSVTPKANELEPGETVAFETRLTAPPEDATGVTLTFAAARTQSKSADVTSDGAAAGPDTGGPMPTPGTVEGRKS